jgi:hypothetical protein
VIFLLAFGGDWMVNEFVSTIIASAAISSMVAGLIIWLSKTWISERLKNAISHEYEEKLETHKAILKANNERDQVRFSNLHEKLEQTIAETYAHLCELQRCIDDYLSPVRITHDLKTMDGGKNVQKALNSFVNFFPPRQIYLPRETSKLVIEFVEELKKTVYSYAIQTVQLKQDEHEERIKAYDELVVKIPPLLDQLEKEFRNLLGHKQ